MLKKVLLQGHNGLHGVHQGILSLTNRIDKPLRRLNLIFYKGFGFFSLLITLFLLFQIIPPLFITRRDVKRRHITVIKRNHKVAGLFLPILLLSRLIIDLKIGLNIVLGIVNCIAASSRLGIQPFNAIESLLQSLTVNIKLFFKIVRAT